MFNIKQFVDKEKGSFEKSFFLFVVVLAVLFVLGSARLGVGAFFFNLILWVSYLYFFKRRTFFGNCSFGVIIAVLLATLLASFYSFDYLYSEKRLPKKESAKEYIGKVYELKSDNEKFWGTAGVVGIEKDEESGEEHFKVVFNIKINDDFPNNGVCPMSPTGCPEGTFHYDYVINLVEPNEDRVDSSEGRLFGTLCNREARPNDPMSYNQELYQCLPAEYLKALKTTTKYFNAHFVREYSSVVDLLTIKEAEVYDASEAWVTEEESTGEGAKGTAQIDNDKAFKRGKRIAKYKLNIEEK